MAFLDKSQTIFVDAVLTELGRQRLATNGSLNITQFALADDGVDYNLFDVTTDADSWDKAILQMPLLEVSTRSIAVAEDGKDGAMKFPLKDSLADTVDAVNVTGIPASTETAGAFDYIVFSPVTENGEEEEYIFTLPDDTFVDVFKEGQIINVGEIDDGGPSQE
tara:strand:+ start:10777 stop:11268 length:492 start_codon:yes stop_codon:yes gene_type:complete